MAGTVNKAILVGHLGADPEIRSTQGGNKVATFSLATSESWRDKATGERKEHTDWHRLVVWNEALVKVVEQYLKKGSKVYVEGIIRTRKYQGNDGADRYVTEIVLSGFNATLTMLDRLPGNAPPPAGDDERPTSALGAPDNDRSSRRPVAGKRDDMDDEIPF
ncbi:single-stranded DNA-binding protein [Xanthobacteraceae bacterium Astr-EGSB]|uniref:single-stranded DNA-binding protein n=1 Tax=Astrobacterium formosum TaxID=3069710 RepID=UPI0027B4DBCE|nr:single-stranded DNA-binding protein [Xanthobacteraceae bacterium Astr-EGSB]